MLARAMELRLNREEYRDQVQHALPIGQHDHFVQLKAAKLLELCREARPAGKAAPADLDMLDVGCGVGLTDAVLKRDVPGLVGVDLDRAALEAAREQNPEVRYVLQEEEAHLPFEDESFDVCFAVGVVHHVLVPAWPAFFAELHRITRRGGCVAIFEHNPWNPLTQWTVRRCPFDEGVTLLSLPRTRRALRDAGFSVERAGYITFFPIDFPGRARIERTLAPLPLGAQHYCWGRRSRA